MITLRLSPSEIDALKAECAATRHLEDIVTREAITYVAARGTRDAAPAFLRLQIAAGYARRRARRAA